ncbi:transporter [Agrobacterium sp. ST15.13.015]|uniref:transporter n=1 Tax=Agrobacterium sp. ST15.13.015 TaxID=3017319 RepID=UPI0022C73C99|nr:hypothetical protein [Agrobacterium sp. ST15.13.015]MCZ7501298.1 hypothetical protein [Rhizobium rhizogenes]
MFSIIPSVSYAQEVPREQDGLGFALEELLTDKGKLRLDVGMTYNAKSGDDISAAYQTIETGAGKFVSVPVNVGLGKREADIAIGTVSARYGLTSKTELFARTSLYTANIRMSGGIIDFSKNETNSGFLNLALGVNQRFIEEGKYPGLIGFIDVTAAEKADSAGSTVVFGKSGAIGLTAYKTLDPVVLSFTAGFRPSLSRSVNGDDINPGDTVFVNPSIAFAVNNELTLTGGLSLRFQGADEVNGKSRSVRQTRGELEFGVAYAVNQTTTFRANAQAEVVGQNGLTLGASIAKKFGGATP